MWSLSKPYELETRQVVVCGECGFYADIPATIVHGKQCSHRFLGAQITKRIPDFTRSDWRGRLASWLFEQIYKLAPINR